MPKKKSSLKNNLIRSGVTTGSVTIAAGIITGLCTAPLTGGLSVLITAAALIAVGGLTTSTALGVKHFSKKEESSFTPSGYVKKENYHQEASLRFVEEANNFAEGFQPTSSRSNSSKRPIETLV